MRERRASRPWSVILGKLRSVLDICLFLASKLLAVDLAGRRLGQLGHELNLTRVLVLAEASAHQIPDFPGERLVPGAVRYNERLDDLAAQLVGDADGRHLENVGMLQHGVLDLDG